MERRLGALAIAVVLVSAVAGLIFQMRSGGERPLTSSGFDIAAVAPPRSPSSAQASGPSASSSGLGMIRSLPGLSVDGAPPAEAPAPFQRPAEPAASAAVGEMVRRTEGPIAALAADYTRRYPVIRRYGRDWMSYPDLKKLNDDYMRRHDPLAFLTGLSQSKSFPLLVKKYAAYKPFHDFILDGVKAAPAEAVQTAFQYVGGDARMKGLVDNVSSALGFPPQAFAQAAGADSVKLDDRQLAKIVSDAQKGAP